MKDLELHFINPKRKVYCAGDMLTRGAQLQRAEEAQMIRDLGHDLYVPQENKAINDKANAIQEGLAERIVKHDTDAILWSDTVIIEPLVNAVGTCVELGQIKGMRDVAEEIVKLIESNKTMNDGDLLYLVKKTCCRHINREVLPHCSDIRRQNTSEQSGDRREFGMHQYIYGVCLDLTNGKGMYEMDEIEEILK